jgi:hypothetical protein
MNATQLAPTPDYSSGLAEEVERCSCDEALALRAEVARLTDALAEAELGDPCGPCGQSRRDAESRLAEQAVELQRLRDENELAHALIDAMEKGGQCLMRQRDELRAAMVRAPALRVLHDSRGRTVQHAWGGGHGLD